MNANRSRQYVATVHDLASMFPKHLAASVVCSTLRTATLPPPGHPLSLDQMRRLGAAHLRATVLFEHTSGLREHEIARLAVAPGILDLNYDGAEILGLVTDGLWMVADTPDLEIDEEYGEVRVPDEGRWQLMAYRICIRPTVVAYLCVQEG
ncbi:hypothetical protein [Nocardioides sp. KR10-350]|uniref:hypothetical protein n=1 Tax=Nocardioides cheoyonin TaxID=3156615 RepID=UPI0032B5E660